MLCPPDLQSWTKMAETYDNLTDSVRIAMVGKYVDLSDSYLSVIKALLHTCIACSLRPSIDWIAASDLEDDSARSALEAYAESMEEAKGHPQQNKNPYLFRSQNFQTRFHNDQGRIEILPRFDLKHPHLRVLRNYRFVEFVLKPQSLFIPHHRDAETVLVSLEGRAIVNIVNDTNRETYQVEQGDVLKVPAGNLVYTANVEENHRFKAANLLLPINIPGRYENFYPSGNQNPRSFYHAFSEKTLEATFNSNYKDIRNILFGKQQEEESSNEGVMVKLSKEQARDIRRQAESRRSPSSSSSQPIINLKNLPPRYSNNHGNLWEARPEQFDILRDLDMSVAILELKKGSVFLPHYNTKAITIAQIFDGRAKLELASPHLAREKSEEDEEDRREGQIQKVTSTVKKDDVFVALAGHPFALRTSKKDNLWMVAFLLSAENNQRNFLGGERDNVINQIPRIVLEKTFEGSGQEVEKLLSKQNKSYFASAEQSDDEYQEDRNPLFSIMDA